MKPLKFFTFSSSHVLDVAPFSVLAHLSTSQRSVEADVFNFQQRTVRILRTAQSCAWESPPHPNGSLYTEEHIWRTKLKRADQWRQESTQVWYCKFLYWSGTKCYIIDTNTDSDTLNLYRQLIQGRSVRHDLWDESLICKFWSPQIDGWYHGGYIYLCSL